jgi:hypothetical protein
MPIDLTILVSRIVRRLFLIMFPSPLPPLLPHLFPPFFLFRTILFHPQRTLAARASFQRGLRNVILARVLRVRLYVLTHSSMRLLIGLINNFTCPHQPLFFPNATRCPVCLLALRGGLCRTPLLPNA